MATLHDQAILDNIMNAEIDFMAHVVILSVLVLFLYDYALNFSSEVEVMWHGGFRIAKLLYFITRYFPFFLPLYNAINMIIDDPSLFCANMPLAHFLEATSIIARAAIITVMIGQTYALWDRSLFILVSLGIIGIASIIADVFQAAVDPCTGFLVNMDPVIIKIFPAIQTGFSILVLILTLYKMIEMVRHQGRKLGSYFEDDTSRFRLTNVIALHSLQESASF